MPDGFKALGGRAGFDELLPQARDTDFHARLVVVILVMAHEFGNLEQSQTLARSAGQAAVFPKI